MRLGKYNDRKTIAYNNAIKETFLFLKNTDSLHELYAKSIALPEEAGYLLPICKLHLNNTELIATLGKWREENAFAFPNQFPVTLEGTASWLSNILKTDDRILFLIKERQGNKIGHIGFANAINDNKEMEIDNVLRGVKNSYAGIMSKALRALINWAEEIFKPNVIFLRVLNDNNHAIEFYRNLSFKENKMIPLKKWVDCDCISYRPLDEDDTSTPDKYFLRMNYSPNNIK